MLAVANRLLECCLSREAKRPATEQLLATGDAVHEKTASNLERLAMKATLTKSVVDRLPAGSIVWDTKVCGLGARRQRGPWVTYVLKHKDRWFTIGKHGSPWTVEGAREKAQSLLGQLVRGQDPRPPSAGTFDEAVTLYLSRRKSALRPRRSTK